jgi:hypothetical protein
LDLTGAQLLSQDGSAVSVRFKLKDGGEFGYVRADRFIEDLLETVFLLGLEVVAGLGPMKLIIYKHDGSEASIDRSRLAESPFVVSRNSPVVPGLSFSRKEKFKVRGPNPGSN